MLVNHSQTVRQQADVSFARSISTGSPQGTVVSPVFIILYTNDCTGTETTPAIHSDDNAIEDFSNFESMYFAKEKTFRTWCKDSWFDLNFMRKKKS